jgi:uncharacterized membrane protein
MIRRNGDLLLAGLVAAAAAAVANLVPNVALRTGFALPLVFVTPGYCLTMAVFGAQRLDGARRTVLSLALSVSLAILGALLLDRLPVGLHVTSWTVLLVALTWLAGAAAAGRRGLQPQTRHARLRLRPADAALLFAAALIAAGAVAFARTPLSAKNAQGYTALWMQPASMALAPAVRVGIESGELKRVPYRLELRVGSSVLFRRLITLEPGERWEQVVRVRPIQVATDSAIQARLYRVDEGPGVYRLVRLGSGRVVERP